MKTLEKDRNAQNAIKDTTLMKTSAVALMMNQDHLFLQQTLFMLTVLRTAPLKIAH